MLKHILVLAAVAFAQIYAEPEASRPRQVKDYLPKPFDWFNLAESWPQSSCWALNSLWKEQEDSCTTCKVTNQWTLHGLWPDSNKRKADGSKDHPSYCSKDKSLKPLALDPVLRLQMSEKWRSYNMRVRNEYFWKHEWEKHGTCALGLEATSTPRKYFLKSLNMLGKHNVGDTLKRAGIVPGGAYNFHRINEAFDSVVFIDCAKNPLTKEQFLLQVYQCFDKQFNLVDCYDGEEIRSSCCQRKQVIYPRALPQC